MKKIIFLLFFVLITSSLHAYPKKIVFSTFSNETNAKEELGMFEKTKIYKEMYALGEKNGFKIYTRESGKYVIVVAEPLNTPEVLKKAYDLAQLAYEDAYYMDSEIMKPKLSKKELEKTELNSSVESPALKKDINTTIETLQKDEEKTALSNLDILLYVTLAFILFVIIFYYIKFKRIYDQY